MCEWLFRFEKATCTCPKNNREDFLQPYEHLKNIQLENKNTRGGVTYFLKFEKFPRREREIGALWNAGTNASCRGLQRTQFSLWNNTSKNNVVNALVDAGKCSFIVVSLTSVFIADYRLPLYSSRPASLPPVWLLVWTFRIHSPSTV